MVVDSKSDMWMVVDIKSVMSINLEQVIPLFEEKIEADHEVLTMEVPDAAILEPWHRLIFWKP